MCVLLLARLSRAVTSLWYFSYEKVKSQITHLFCLSIWLLN